MRAKVWMIAVFCLGLGGWGFHCTPQTPEEKAEEGAGESGFPDASEVAEEFVGIETAIEPKRPDGPYPTETMEAVFTTPKAGHQGDVTQIVGVMKSQGAPITAARWTLYAVDQEAYWNGTSFGSDQPVWEAWPGTEGFALDVRGIRLEWGLAYTLLVEMANGAEEYSRSFQTWLQGLKWKILAWSGRWKIAGGDLESDLYLAGYQGVVLRTEASGEWFSPLALPGAREIRVLKGGTGVAWVIGDRGGLWRSEDKATTWVGVELPKEVAARDLEKLAASRDEKTLLIAGEGGLLLRSSDGGKTWASLLTPFQGKIKGLCPLGSGLWMALEEKEGSPRLWRSEDQAGSWAKVELPQGMDVVEALLCSASTDRVWLAGGEAKIYRSEDRGATWSQGITDLAETTGLTLYALGGDRQEARLYAVGEKGVGLISEDQGATWKTLRPPKAGEASLRDLRVSEDGSKGLWVGDEGVILTTKDRGKTWERKTAAPLAHQGPYRTASFPAGPVVGWVGGKDGIVQTEDAGKTWQEVLRGEEISSIAWPQEGIGVAVGTKICRSEDRGKTWACTALPVDGPLYKVTFLNANLGFTVGAKGAVLQTTDGGRSWKTLLIPTGEDLHGLAVFSDTLFLVSGSKGLIMKTKDGARTWQTQDSTTQGTLYDLQFPIDELVGYAVGAGGVIVKTEDGGTWVAQRSGVKAHLYAVLFPTDALEGYAVGEKGAKLKTTDGGKTWKSFPIYHKLDLFGLAFPGGSRVGYVVGEEKLVLFTLGGFE